MGSVLGNTGLLRNKLLHQVISRLRQGALAVTIKVWNSFFFVSFFYLVMSSITLSIMPSISNVGYNFKKCVVAIST